ncbi:CBS/transporter associated domain protein [Escherichia coli]|uniref:CBS/transporter associated domain protein n=1 Tax=Escherichia coli TaxID=562 RepID=A0A376L9D6_ECOLX|nr:CBS/transporter associated domain protein [Escherichia coli]
MLVLLTASFWKRWRRSPVAGTRVRIGEYDIDILDVQDNMIKQVKVFPVKPLRESVAE